jgi:hypothetical protein
MAYCQAFFISTDKKWKRKVVILKPQEYKLRRTLNTASSVSFLWKYLITAVDSEILAGKKHDNLTKKEL